MAPVVVTAVVLAAVNVVLIVMILGRRAWVARTRRRHDELVTRLRPAAVQLIEADPTGPPPALRRAEQDVFAGVLAGYSRQLRGASRRRITAYFEQSGAVDKQLRRLRRGPTWRRAVAAFMLGDMASTRAVADLVRALADRAPDVRMAAARSLGRVRAHEAIEPLVAAGVDGRVPRDVTGLALFDIGSQAVPALRDLLGHTDPAMRASAVELIGLLGAAGDSDPLVDHLTDPAAAVRVATAGALGRLGAAEARDGLMRSLDDRVPRVRAAAARALGQIGGRQAAAALLPVAREDAFDPARDAADALARIDPRLVVEAASRPDCGPHLTEAADRVAIS